MPRPPTDRPRRAALAILGAAAVGVGTALATGRIAAQGGAGMIRYELHFQELFAGTDLRAEIDGRPIELPLLTTNFSTGLAHIETVEGPDGADLHLETTQPPDALRLRLEAARPIVLIRREAGRLSAVQTDRSPGYL